MAMYRATSPVSSTRLAMPTSSRLAGNTSFTIATPTSSRTLGTSSRGLGSIGSSSIAPVTTPSSLSQTMTSGARVFPGQPASGRILTAGQSPNFLSASRPATTATTATSPVTTATTAQSPVTTARVVSSVAAPAYPAGSVLSSSRAAPVTTVYGGLPTTTAYAGVDGTYRQAKVLSGGIGGASGYMVQAAPLTTIYGGATLAPTYVASNPIAGAGATQSAYEAKHQGDAQLANLKELKSKCGLRKVPVKAAAEAFKYAAAGTGSLTRDQFFEAHSHLLDACGVDHPPPEVKNAVFDLFDRDDNGSVDMMEIVCGISLLCRGTEEDKVEAVFMMFDENGDGYVTVDEMYKFLSTVFKVVCTPAVMSVVNESGVDTSAEDMASATTMECFQTADLNHDGKLSLDEFKKWFNAPRNDPAVLFEPVSAMLA